jgi:hypothetical protein
MRVSVRLALGALCLSVTIAGVAWADGSQPPPVADPDPDSDPVADPYADPAADPDPDPAADPDAADPDPTAFDPSVPSTDPYSPAYDPLSRAPGVVDDQTDIPEGARDPRWVDSPYAPHHPTGMTMRAGTEVGYVYAKRLEVLALGGTLAVGHRWDRLAVEAGYTYLAFSELGPGNTALGRAHRLAATVRFEPLRFGSSTVGENSMLAVYVEASAARVLETWFRPSYNQTTRVVPDGGSHSEGSLGFGFLLDHRLERPSRLSRVGWMFGWRLVAAPNAPEDYVVCRGAACARTIDDPMPMKRSYETALLFTSSLELTW